MSETIAYAHWDVMSGGTHTEYEQWVLDRCAAIGIPCVPEDVARRFGDAFGSCLPTGFLFTAGTVWGPQDHPLKAHNYSAFLRSLVMELDFAGIVQDCPPISITATDTTADMSDTRAVQCECGATHFRVYVLSWQTLVKCVLCTRAYTVERIIRPADAPSA